MSDTSPTIRWETTAFTIDLVLNEAGAICVRSILPARAKAQKSASLLFESSELPLVSVKLAGEGNTAGKTAKALVGSYLSQRLKYENHEIQKDGQVETLEINSRDAVIGILVIARLSIYGEIPALRSSATITNESKDTDITVTQLSSIAVGGLTTKSQEWYHGYTLLTATNGWFREAQWREQTLPEIGIDNDGICELPDGHSASQATFSLQSRGSFSTSSHLPMGALRSIDDKDTWLWQVENNGSWRWEIGDYKDSIYLAAGGPTGMDHNWKQVLKPGQSFSTVPVALTRVAGGVEAAFAALTDYRRQIRRPHEDNENLPIIFNDYMNCLMGDPDENKVAALLDPVAKMGAEYFVIDAGWYADDSTWWDDVGLWEPSQKRFPSGFKVLLDKIRSKGLIPGLWLEPEVVGVRSIVANRLPKEAFFQECGQRIVENGRFQLDYHHPEVRTWMDTVIHNLVVNYGAGYFKFDYNIEVTQGTDIGGSSSTGVAHLEHQRAYLSWVRSLLDRYPTLVIENCSSGGQRMEYAMLSVHSLQSTSDQQDPTLYAAIAAAMPTAVVPEQSATWAYPQPEWSDELNALSVVNSLLGRVYLSGRLDKLSPDQLGLVVEGMDVYKRIRFDLKSAHPMWPLGLPRWHDDWLSLALATKDNGIYLAIWRRGGATEKDLPLRFPNGQYPTTAKVLYPSRFETDATWNETSGMLSLKLSDTTCARLFHLL
ncbi:Aldolase-type TIM barrel [Penicillium griseofulvum]|uniref:alpha-galactosidase n=1 Tax=Penicillium patulum TaxID=5078 RepID=A0A135LCM8_PENPA|nr:Aldolase-type TIM barrel [Penicillium griseofulvum]KXG46728.1 Aldolase-type TIM barrel [Penicillium griseofulvum]